MSMLVSVRKECTISVFSIFIFLLKWQLIHINASKLPQQEDVR